jgi:hypothetical protein
MSSISTPPRQIYPAPSLHGDLQLTGLRGWVARRPLTGFLVIALGLSWLLFSIPVLAFHGVIPGANLPVEVFALASTLLILLPTDLWVTSITDGRAGVRALLRECFVGGSASAGGWWCCLVCRRSRYCWAADGRHDACRLGQRVGSRGLASDLRCQQQRRRAGRFPTRWSRCRQHDPVCRRHTDRAHRRVAALATFWRIRQTSDTASRFSC